MAAPMPLRTLSDEELEAIAREFCLEKEACEQLNQLIRRMVIAIDLYRADLTRAQASGGRSARIQSLQRWSAALDDLTAILKAPNAGPNRALCELYVPWLVRLFEPEAFEYLLGIRFGYGMGAWEFGGPETNGMESPFESLRREMQRRKDEMSRELTIPLLLAFIEELKQPVRSRLNLERRAKGGSPGKPERNYVVDELAAVFFALTGKRPTSTPSGPFMLLCEHVLIGMGLPTDGLEKATQRILRKKSN